MTSLTPLIPIAVVALALWGLVQWAGARPWHLLVAVVLGVILSGTVLGPDIHQLLSQLTGGRLH
jgi:type IV secretory pathway VirB2 component (pilin)